MPALDLEFQPASLTIDAAPPIVLELAGEGGTVTLELQPAVVPALVLDNPRPELTLADAPAPMELDALRPQLSLEGDSGAILLEMAPILRGPAGPPGPPGDGSAYLGGYPVEVAEPQVADLLQFQHGAWVNSSITDGGNF